MKVIVTCQPTDPQTGNPIGEQFEVIQVEYRNGLDINNVVKAAASLAFANNPKIESAIFMVHEDGTWFETYQKPCPFHGLMFSRKNTN